MQYPCFSFLWCVATLQEIENTLWLPIKLPIRAHYVPVFSWGKNHFWQDGKSPAPACSLCLNERNLLLVRQKHQACLMALSCAMFLLQNTTLFPHPLYGGCCLGLNVATWEGPALVPHWKQVSLSFSSTPLIVSLLFGLLACFLVIWLILWIVSFLRARNTSILFTTVYVASTVLGIQ